MAFKNITDYVGEGVFAVVTAITSFFGALFWARRKHIAAIVDEKAAASAARDARLVDLERQVGLLTQTVQPLSAAFQAILVKQLSHFHTPHIDLLLSKLGPPVLLTAAEEIELAKELQQRALDLVAEISAGEREAAMMLPYVIQRVRREAVQKVPLDVVLVAVPRSYE
jgi:hypothetical protein